MALPRGARRSWRAQRNRVSLSRRACGSGICWYGGSIKHLPTKIYHGDLDEVVPITESITMLKALHKNGGHAELKICYGVGHNAWETAYTDPDLIDWMLAQKRKG